MKIVHLTRTLADGAGRAVHEIHHSLLRAGVDSTLIVGEIGKRDRQSYSNVVCILDQLPLSTSELRNTQGSAVLSFFQYIYAKFINLYRVILLWRWGPKSLFNFQLSFVLLRILKYHLIGVELICVYSVQTFLSPKDIFRVATLTQAPLVWIPMDIEPLTGGCHFNNGCLAFTEACATCPQLSPSRGPSRSKKQLEKKRHYYQQLPLSYLATSSAVESWVRHSTVAGGKKLCTGILLGVNSRVFHKMEKKSARRKLGIRGCGIVLLFGAFDLDNPRKGAVLLIDALDHVFNKEKTEVEKRVVAKTELVMIGNSKTDLLKERCPFPIQPLGRIHDDEMLAIVYNSVDVLVVPSVDDAGPLMINEAVACETSVVAFNRGVARDLIVSPALGGLVDQIDGHKFGDRLLEVLVGAWEGSTEKDVGPQKRWAANRVSSDYQAKQYVRAFRQIISKHNE